MLASTIFVIQTRETSLSSFRVGLHPFDSFLRVLAWILHRISQLVRDRNQEQRFKYTLQQLLAA